MAIRRVVQNPALLATERGQRLARPLLWPARVKTGVSSLIGIRHLGCGSRRIFVLLTRNEGGSVAARCFLGGTETPIIDGPRAAEVLATVGDALDALLYARRLRSSAHGPRLASR